MRDFPFVRRRGVLLSAAALAGCANEAPPAAVVAYPERSLPYAPLLLAVKRGLYAEPGVKVALSHFTQAGAVAAAVATGRATVGAMSLPELVRAGTEGAPLVACGALTRRLDCHLVVTTARSVPSATLAAIHLGEWRGLRVGVEGGADGSEAFARLATGLGMAGPGVLYTPPAPRLPQRELAAAQPLDAETRWATFETEEGLAAALTDRRLEGFIGRAYAAAQTLSYGSGRVVSEFVGPDEATVMSALPTVLVTRRDGLSSTDEEVTRQIIGAVGRAVEELTGPAGKEALTVALPERDSLFLTLAHGLFSPSQELGAYAAGARLGADSVERYVGLSAITGARVDINPGVVTTTRFSG